MVIEASTDHPVPFAHLTITDVKGRAVGSVLTDEVGRFIWRASGTGRYLVRVDRIGYRSETTKIDVHQGAAAVSVTLSLESEAVELPPLTVEGERRCRMREEDGAVLSDLWGEARKVLTLTLSGQNEANYVRATEYERTLDIATLRILEQKVHRWEGFSSEPFRSAPPADLARSGYIQPEGDAYRYYGLSPKVLVSGEFLQTHCFRTEPPGDDEDTNEIGLGFEPAPGRNAPDVAGVLWLDRRTAELRRVEYAYTGYPYPVALPTEMFGGRMLFAQTDDGAWIVTRWWIRMPQFERVVHSDELPRGVTVRGDIAEEANYRWELRRVGVSVREVGGYVQEVSADPLGASSGRIEGEAFDSLQMEPLAHAKVFVNGLRYETLTDERGAFVLDSVPEGFRVVTLNHPVLDALGVDLPSEAVTVRGGDTTRITLAVPSAETTLGGRCGEGEGFIVGFASAGPEAEPLAGVTITALWSHDWRRHGDEHIAEITAKRAEAAALSGESGAYAICGVPPGAALDLAATRHHPKQTHRLRFIVPENGRGRVDFRFRKGRQ